MAAGSRRGARSHRRYQGRPHRRQNRPRSRTSRASPNLAGPFGVDVQRDGTITVALQGAPPDPESGFPGEPGRIIKAKKGNVTTLKSFDGAGPSDVATGALRSHLLDRR